MPNYRSYNDSDLDYERGYDEGFLDGKKGVQRRYVRSSRSNKALIWSSTENKYVFTFDQVHGDGYINGYSKGKSDKLENEINEASSKLIRGEPVIFKDKNGNKYKLFQYKELYKLGLSDKSKPKSLGIPVNKEEITQIIKDEGLIPLLQEICNKPNLRNKLDAQLSLF